MNYDQNAKHSCQFHIRD